MRINPNIDAHTHDHITTGLEGDKFGIALHEIDEALLAINNRPNLLFVGVHFHVGSQIDDMVVFEKLAEKASDIVKNIEKTGTEVRVINIGGGLAIDYVSVKENTVPDFVGYFDAVHKHISVRDDQEIHFEFGRAIVANCGLLITKVLFNKKAGGKEVVIVDAGMTELMRPALYGAYHHIENISSTLPSEKYTIVGPICESTDTFAEDRELAETKRGDYLAIYSAGAYGQTMSSEYNHRKKADTHYLSDK